MAKVKNNINKDELKLIKKIKDLNCNESFVELSKGYDNFYYIS